MQGGLLLRCKLCPFGKLGDSLVGDASDGHKQGPLVTYDLFRAAGILVHLEGIARGRINGRERRVQTERNVNAAANGYQLPLKLKGPLGPAADMGKPRGDGLLPEQDSVMGVAGYKMPFGR